MQPIYRLRFCRRFGGVLQGSVGCKFFQVLGGVLPRDELVIQTFETVVPAERTKLTVNITDGSVKAHAPTHPGALVFYVGDLTLNTDIVGDAPSSHFHVLIPELSILLLDDLGSRTDGSIADKVSMNQGVGYWKVRSHIPHRLR